MAAPTIRQIRQGCADRLDTISGLHAYSYIPGQFTTPSGIVGMPFRPETETMVRGTDTYEVSLWIVLARQSDRHAEEAIEQYLNPTGATSVRAAMFADTTLGGAVNSIHEIEAAPTDFNFGTNEDPQIYVGLEFRYRILAAGKD